MAQVFTYSMKNSNIYNKLKRTPHFVFIDTLEEFDDTIPFLCVLVSEVSEMAELRNNILAMIAEFPFITVLVCMGDLPSKVMLCDRYTYQQQDFLHYQSIDMQSVGRMKLIVDALQ